MFKFDDEELASNLECYFEKMEEFGFYKIESTILLMNAGEKTDAKKILKVVDYIEPPECGGVTREDVDRETALKEIERILVEG